MLTLKAPITRFGASPFGHISIFAALSDRQEVAWLELGDYPVHEVLSTPSNRYRPKFVKVKGKSKDEQYLEIMFWRSGTLSQYSQHWYPRRIGVRVC